MGGSKEISRLLGKRRGSFLGGLECFGRVILLLSEITGPYAGREWKEGNEGDGGGSSGRKRAPTSPGNGVNRRHET